MYPVKIKDCYLICGDGTKIPLGEGFVFCNNYRIVVYGIGISQRNNSVAYRNSVTAYFLNVSTENGLELFDTDKGDIEGKNESGNPVKLESVLCAKQKGDLFGNSILKFEALQFKRER